MTSRPPGKKSEVSRACCRPVTARATKHLLLAFLFVQRGPTNQEIVIPARLPGNHVVDIWTKRHNITEERLYKTEHRPKQSTFFMGPSRSKDEGGEKDYLLACAPAYEKLHSRPLTHRSQENLTRVLSSHHRVFCHLKTFTNNSRPTQGHVSANIGEWMNR